MSDARQSVTITICLGSSCFARGNARNVEVVQQFIASPQAAVDVQLQGHLCRGQCTAGPNILIDQQAYHEVDPVTLAGLLHRELGEGRRSKP